MRRIPEVMAVKFTDEKSCQHAQKQHDYPVTCYPKIDWQMHICLPTQTQLFFGQYILETLVSSIGIVDDSANSYQHENGRIRYSQRVARTRNDRRPEELLQAITVYVVKHG